MDRKTKTTESVPGYDVLITGRRVEVTDAMKGYVIEKVAKIERFTDRIIDCQVTMDLQKQQHRVDILLQFGHVLIKGTGSSDNMYASIDQAVDRIQKQVRRYKKRIQDHHGKSLSSVDMNVNVVRPHFNDDLETINDEIEDENVRQTEEHYRPHEIVESRKIAMPMLSNDEAIMRMELSGDSFLVFRAEEDQGIKVIHRLPDGNFGIISVS
ncbi:MAG: ribosome-associated translation inhibitor RaiA [Chlamydiia bacterium]|nr:ribosome-associated translation inhibitor RaiA [Chlamydiia bacterium]